MGRKTEQGRWEELCGFMAGIRGHPFPWLQFSPKAGQGVDALGGGSGPCRGRIGTLLEKPERVAWQVEGLAVAGEATLSLS